MYSLGTPVNTRIVETKKKNKYFHELLHIMYVYALHSILIFKIVCPNWEKRNLIGIHCFTENSTYSFL